MTNTGKPARKGQPPPTQLPAATWRKLVAKAWAGEPRFLMDALLVPQQTDGAGRPLPGAWVALPDDAELREQIVNVLMRGPWGNASSLGELATKTGWGSGKKPRVSDLEVAAADWLATADGGRLASELVDELAASLELEGDSLRKRITALRRKQRGSARKKAP